MFQHSALTQSHVHPHETQTQARQLKPAITNRRHKHAREVLFKEGIGHFLRQVPDFSFFFLPFPAQKMRSLGSSKQLVFFLRCTSHVNRWTSLSKSL